MGKGYTVGMLVPSVWHYRGPRDYFSRVITSARQELERHGCQVVALVSVEATLALNGVDGWIVVTDDIHMQSVYEVGKPVITIAAQHPTLEIPAVISDNRGGMQRMVGHLVGHGHRRIGFVGCRRFFDLQQRYEGYWEALSRYGVAFDEKYVIEPGDNTVEETYRVCVERVVGSRCRAWVCATDVHAEGLLRAARELGYRLPEQLAVVSFDNIEHAGYMEPPLTTVNQDVGALGRVAAGQIVKWLEEGERPPEVSIVGTGFVVRNSCGCRGEWETSGVSSAAYEALMSEYNWLFKIVDITYRISTHVFGDEVLQAQQLTWLQYTGVSKAYLALWVERGGVEQRELVISGVYNPRGYVVPALGSVYGADVLPPASVLEVCGEDALFSLVIPVRTAQRNWGVLHVWLGNDEPFFMYVLWAQLLASALERASLLRMVQHFVALPTSLMSATVRVECGVEAVCGRIAYHADVQLWCVESGSMAVLMDGREVVLEDGQLAVCWGAMPRVIVDCAEGSRYSVMYVPLGWILQRGLPDVLMQPLLYGRLLVGSGGRDDVDMLRRWAQEVGGGSDDEVQMIVLVEVEARLRRLVRELKRGEVVRGEEYWREGRKSGRQGVKVVERMMQFVVGHYHEPLHVEDIARVVGLNASYATTLFRSVVGTNLKSYLTRYRIAHAQRWLVTTDKAIASIAFETGFSSVSQFYAAFKRECGQSPHVYRRLERV